MLITTITMGKQWVNDDFWNLFLNFIAVASLSSLSLSLSTPSLIKHRKKNLFLSAMQHQTWIEYNAIHIHEGNEWIERSMWENHFNFSVVIFVMG